MEAQKAIELEIPNLKDADKESIEKKYANLIAQVKEDKIDKAEVIKLGKAAENYIKNVKESRGEKKIRLHFLMRVFKTLVFYCEKINCKW